MVRLVKKGEKGDSRGWFRSIDLWVMGPARSHCATLLLRRAVYIICNLYVIIVVIFMPSSVEAQSQLSLAVEKERSATEKSMTLQSRVTQLERQAATLRQEKSRLTASLELERAKAETLEESQQRCVHIFISSTGLHTVLCWHRDSAKTEAVRTSLQQSLEELRKEKVSGLLYMSSISTPHVHMHTHTMIM